MLALMSQDGLRGSAQQCQMKDLLHVTVNARTTKGFACGYAPY